MTVALFYWAFIQNFILGAAIALHRRTPPNYLLAGIFTLTGLNVLAQYYFHFTDLKYALAEVIWLPDIIDLVLPVLLLLYLIQVLNTRWPARPMLYFLPAGATTGVLAGYVLLTPDFTFFDYIRTDLHCGVLLTILVWKVFITHRAVQLLRRRRAALRAKSLARYYWPFLLCTFLAATTLLALINFVHVTWVAPHHPPTVLATVRQVVKFVFVTFNSSIVLVVIYYLFRHPKLLSGKPILKPIISPAATQLSTDCQKLLAAVESDRVYLDDELNEQALAKHLALPTYVLSRLLNEELGKSFSTFINEYRVREAQRILSGDRDKRMTNFAIALESGFRSESVFYVNFKKFTGTTPSRFRKAVRGGEAMEAA